MSTLSVIATYARLPLTQLMQASLVRNVAFSLFENELQGFNSSPENVSLLWNALEALEGSCVVQVVERFKKRNFKAHVPDSVMERVESLSGHRHIVSHPAHRAGDWTHAKMRQFEADGRRHESRLPLVWRLHQALNTELLKDGQAPLPDFQVTIEMAQMLRMVWSASMKPINFPGVPDDEELLELLRKARDNTLHQCLAEAQ